MLYFFFFNDTATTEIYTLSLHDALPISTGRPSAVKPAGTEMAGWPVTVMREHVRIHSMYEAIGVPLISVGYGMRSEEHTSELQSRQYLVCRLLLEKKKNNN